MPSTDSTSDGSLSASVRGGVMPYDYLWLPDSQITKTLDNIPADTFALFITDVNGCTVSQEIMTNLLLVTCINGCSATDNLPNCNVVPVINPNCTNCTLSITDFGAIE